MQIRVSVIRLLLLILFAGTSAAAQEEHPRFELFAQGGASFFTSKSQPTIFVSSSFPTGVDAISRSSFASSGRLFTGGRFYFGSKEAVEASYAFSTNRLRTTIEAAPPASGTLFFDSDSMRIHQVQFGYVRYFRSAGRLQPFAAAGLGFVAYSAFGDSDVKFAGNFGGGVDVRLHRRVNLRVESRDVVTELPDLAFERGIVHNLVPSAGFAFRF